MNVFLTGATGFLGRRLLPVLLRDPDVQVRCLVRDATGLPRDPRVVAVPGSLPDLSDSAREALRGADRVLHLAALTGKARPEEHERVNVAGTQALLAAARDAGVPRFLHVSTIAVRYPELRHYPYGRAKAAAESAVRSSGLDWAILRPTVVFGPGSPVGEGLRGLASGAVLPLFDSGRARLHPVHVDDVAEALGWLASEASLGERTIDFGGRETTTFADFLDRLRRARTGKTGPRVSIPLGPVIPLVALAERVAFDVVPVSAGQFYAFRHDGIAAEDPGVNPPVEARRGLAEIVGELVVDDETGRPGDPSAEAPSAAELDHECDVFTRYLIGAAPGDALRAHYRRAHEPGRHGPGGGDDSIVRFARRSPFATRLADTWAALFDRSGLLRRKLVLLLAMLESQGDTVPRVDGPTVPSAAAFGLGALAHGIGFVILLPVAGLALVWHRLRGGSG